MYQLQIFWKGERFNRAGESGSEPPDREARRQIGQAQSVLATPGKTA